MYLTPIKILLLLIIVLLLLTDLKSLSKKIKQYFQKNKRKGI